MVFDDFPINFRITCGKYGTNFKENSWNFGEIARNFWRHLRENEKKILKDSRKIMETLAEKTEVIRNWCWYYEEVLESFPEIISLKFVKNCEEILEKLWKDIGNTSQKL